jgi:hypothetical protein
MADTATIPVIGTQPLGQLSATETYSDSILGPVSFRLSNLRIAGSSVKPAAPSQSPYIIAANETFAVSVDIEFNKTPLTSLLMCLGTKVKMDFAFEGYGKNAAELDLMASLTTVKGQYKYTLTFTGVPQSVAMTPGLYEVAAVATIGPVDHQCSTCVFGHGYIGEVLLEVYAAGEECGI